MRRLTADFADFADFLGDWICNPVAGRRIRCHLFVAQHFHSHPSGPYGANPKPPPLGRGFGLDAAAAPLKICVNLCHLRFSSPHGWRREFPSPQLPGTSFPSSSPHAAVKSRVRGVLVCAGSLIPSGFKVGPQKIPTKICCATAHNST